jgi:hypothetical protein
MFNISQAAIEQAINDLRSGASDDFVQSFFANRPDWQDNDDQASTQTDDQQAEKQQETAKA